MLPKSISQNGFPKLFPQNLSIKNIIDYYSVHNYVPQFLKKNILETYAPKLVPETTTEITRATFQSPKAIPKSVLPRAQKYFRKQFPKTTPQNY